MTSRHDPLEYRLACSAFSASIAETITFPLDLIKVRLQISTQQKNSAFATAISLIRQEGVFKLYTGLAPAILRHLPYTSIRVSLFETLRSRWQQSHQPDATIPLPTLLAFGFISGGTAQFIATPFDLVKIRLQGDARDVALGIRSTPRYRGIVHALTDIAQNEGGALRGWWRGSLASVQRAALVNLGELTTYDYAKKTIISSGISPEKDSIVTHFLSSLTSGLCSSLISTPADVIKTRLLNQNPAHPQYKGIFDCFMKTWRNEGMINGLYKGFLPTWARLGPWQVCFWLTYEQSRKIIGLESF